MTPIGWETTMLKYVADCNRRVLSEATAGNREFKYVDIGAVGQGNISIPETLTKFADAPSRARRVAEQGDTIVSTVRTYLRAVATVPETDDDLVFSTGFAVLHPRPHVSRRFLAYALQGDTFVDKVVANSVGVSYPAITASDLMALDLVLPCLEEQRCIADYLDHETTQIDALVAKQEELVGALKERRSSIVDLLLTSGSSKKTRLKNLLIRNDGGVWGDDVEGDGGTVVLRSTEQTVDGRWNITDPAVRGLSVSEFNAARLEVGDLVVTKTSGSSKHIGKATLVDQEIASLPACHGNFMQRLRVRSIHSSKFLWYCLNSRIIREQFVLLSTTSTGLANLNGVSIGSVLVPSHQGARQAAIAEQLDEQTSRIDALIAKAEEHIALAKERRSALITAAVTGRIDVRTARKAN